MKIVCLGDSLTFGYGVKSKESWVSLLNEWQLGEFVNRGIPGDTTEHMRSRFGTDVMDCKPSHVFIMGGTNDLFLQIDIDDVIHNIADMVRMSCVANIHPLVLFPPLIIDEVKAKQLFADADYKAVNQSLQEYRKRLKQYAVKNTITHIDVLEAFGGSERMNGWYLEDGIHITPGFHRQIASFITKLIRKDLFLNYT